jgi:penicillin-binding protein 2
MMKPKPMTQKRLLIHLLLALVLTSACDTLLNAGSPNADSGEPIEVTQVTSVEPADVLRDFITAWSTEDYDTMYSLIANQSRTIYPRQIFENRYTVAHTAIRFDGVEHTLNDVVFQGDTAILDYNVGIKSPTFSVIEDNNRIMRMVQEGGWKIAWSPMDIFDGLSSEARVQVNSRFPNRENIYDRNGKVLAEQNGTVLSLYASQQDMNRVEDCVDTLAAATRQQANVLRRIFADYFVETRFHIAEMDPERFNQFRDALAYDCGIVNSDDAFSNVLQYTTRRYYGHGIASHLVGYIGRVPGDQVQVWQARGYDETNIVGLTGVENAYEEVLAGRPERFLRIVEPGGTVIRELGGTVGTQPQSVTLTIDRDMQEYTAEAMVDAVNYALPNWGGITLGGAIVAMDVNTGAILSLASYPTFDPHIFNPDTQYNVVNAFERINSDQRSPLQNKAVSEQYTPGSVYKVVTSLAATSEGIWQPDQIFNCDLEWRGQQRFGDALEVRYDWRILNDLESAGEITMTQALTSSCNPFFWEVGALMFQEDPDLLNKYARLLGLGQQTGIEVIGPEASGNLAEPTVSTQAINNSIGQGDVSVTALQMAQVTALIANGGKMYKPYFVSHIGEPDTDGYEVINEPTLIRDLELDTVALEGVRKGMCDVVSDTELGTAWFVFEDANYTVCGKTGTAQTAGAPNAWFIAYYPAEDPQIAFAGVMANSREGSEVVAPMIRRILDNYLGEPEFEFPRWWQGEYVALPIQTELFGG